MLAFSSALLAGLFGYFLTGSVSVDLKGVKSVLGEVGAKATGGAGLFLQIVLVWWLSPAAPVGVEKQLEDIKADTDAIKKDTSDVKQGVNQVDAKLDEVARSIHEKLGANNLGPDYDKVNYHRDYQDEYLKKDGKIESLIAEYRRRVSQAPRNAMYRYLLARVYDQAARYPEARAEAKAGAEADDHFFWNRRFLLYFSVPDSFDLAECLALEMGHYQITADEERLFAGSPEQVMRAFRQVKERFRDEPMPRGPARAPPLLAPLQGALEAGLLRRQGVQGPGRPPGGLAAEHAEDKGAGGEDGGRRHPAHQGPGPGRRDHDRKAGAGRQDRPDAHDPGAGAGHAHAGGDAHGESPDAAGGGALLAGGGQPRGPT